MPQRVGVAPSQRTSQRPARHDEPEEQARPQAPQLASSDASSTHASPQRVVGARHSPATQTPEEQTRPAGHALLQRPQWALTVWVLVSQPSEGSLLQSAKPGSQAMAQAPLRHAPAACAGEGHARPQAPQCAGVDERSWQRGPQRVVGASQVREHTPAEQTSPDRHDPPQRPQLPGSLRRSVSQPSAGSPLQSSQPARQTRSQRPLAQAAVALGRRGHALPQAPQFRTSRLGSEHAPPHRWLGASHADPHAPRLHTPPAAQALPQRPQCAVLVVRSVSQPSRALSLQSPQPASQSPMRQSPDAHVALA